MTSPAAQSAATPASPSATDPSPDADGRPDAPPLIREARERQAQIARRALTKAQAQGFSGRSLSDWRDAEAEYEAERTAKEWALARDFARSNDLLPRDFRPFEQD